MSQKQVTEEVVEVNEAVEKAKDFWAKFSKPIIYAGTAIIVLLGGWFGYKKFVVAPKEAKSVEAIFAAEKLFDKMAQQTGFNKDSINLVLNGGNGISTGVLKVISTYSGTSVANRAHYIAGACYLHSGDFNNAVKHLKEFSTPATQVQTAAYMMMGDAYAELKNDGEALNYYKKATTVNSKDEFMTSEALFKAAMFAENTGKSSDAVDMFKRIKDEYPRSSHIMEADKYLAKLGVLN